ncbi:PREDICTED: uncharacterized protein LOC104707851 [Camelina sativa]|uniref:Uncharacterized protein LOC104707851 n=1 Tax=Camelina sativa TaxID=90675 RepID=A0ABM0T8R4_CAMSA|nr:PREDICTED: uncharacterized protein LOC104707851 [Camelina sativa]
METMVSQSSGSASNSMSRCWSPNCKCGRPSTVVKSWTNDNLGRRFYRCGVHGFVDWADEEKPYGWQKRSLLEARDEICRQKETINVLKESLTNKKEEGVRGSPIMNIGLVNKLEQEKNQLENEVRTGYEREKLLWQFIVLSWGGFIVVIRMIIGMGKK